MYSYVTSFEQLGQFIADIQKPVTEIGFDTETTGKDFFRDKVLLVQVKIADSIYIFDARKLGDKYIKYIVQVLQDSGKTLVSHNGKFDVKFIKQQYGELLTNVFDLMIAEGIIRNTSIKDKFLSLAELVKIYCNVELDKSTRANFYQQENPVITEQELIYSALDVQYLEYIRQKQIEKLVQQKQLQVMDLEMRLLPVIASMELEGVKLDKEAWKKLAGPAFEEAEALRKELVHEFFDKILEKVQFNNALELADFLLIKEGNKRKKERELLSGITEIDFVRTRLEELLNINSSDQLLNILQNVYKIPIQDTNETTINKFLTSHPIINKILQYRERAKKVSTYGDTFLQNINPETGRIHTEFNQLGNVSGRISSSSPNLQNIPKESEYRNAFVARPHTKIIAVDFSQEELRILARVANVKGMIDAYKKGQDLHTKTASGLFSISVEELQALVDQENKDAKYKRNRGKTLNFAVGYGSTKYGLYKNFGVPMDEGEVYLNMFYKELYPEIDQCKKFVGEKILSLGYSVTMAGRKRFFEIKSFFPGGWKEKERYEASILREGFNHIIQGTGAEIIKESLVRVFYENPFGDKLKILLQVYDEIVCEVDEDIVEEAKQFISNIMIETERKYLNDIVPAVVDAKVATYWSH